METESSAAPADADDWDALAGWWAAEVEDDPAYAEEVLPLLGDVLRPEPGRRYLDLGCGEGQGMRAVVAAGGAVVGCDASMPLLRRARRAGPAVLGRLPEVAWARSGAFDGAYAVLVLEHVEDVGRLFVEARRVVRADGVLAVVVNHPVFTSPGAGPFVDPQDGETLWRWGSYLTAGESREPAGAATVVFYHRPLADLLTIAAAAGWAMAELVELAVGEAAADRDPLLAAQRDVPRLLGVRWRAA